jgi:precorrin-2 methylase
MVDCRIFVVGTLHDGVDGAGLLTVSAVDALCHVDVVARSSSRTIRTRLALNCDGVRRTGSRAEFARNASCYQ